MGHCRDGGDCTGSKCHCICPRCKKADGGPSNLLKAVVVGGAITAASKKPSITRSQSIDVPAVSLDAATRRKRFQSQCSVTSFGSHTSYSSSIQEDDDFLSWMGSDTPASPPQTPDTPAPSTPVNTKFLDWLKF